MKLSYMEKILIESEIFIIIAFIIGFYIGKKY